jgi:hypothetical protein
MTQTRSTRPSPGWYFLLLLPCFGMLAVPLYNRMEPSLAGVPFFYWYQFAWVPLAAGLTAFVHVVTDRPDAASKSNEQLGSAP